MRGRHQGGKTNFGGRVGAAEFKQGVVSQLLDAGFVIELALDDDATIVEMYRAVDIRARPPRIVW